MKYPVKCKHVLLILLFVSFVEDTSESESDALDEDADVGVLRHACLCASAPPPYTRTTRASAQLGATDLVDLIPGR